MRDLGTGATRLVSRVPGGPKADATSGDPTISADGAVVAFMSAASTLVPDGVRHVLVRDLRDDTLTVADRGDGADGTLANSYADDASISADGRSVALDQPCDHPRRRRRPRRRPGLRARPRRPHDAARVARRRRRRRAGGARRARSGAQRRRRAAPSSTPAPRSRRAPARTTRRSTCAPSSPAACRRCRRPTAAAVCRRWRREGRHRAGAVEGLVEAQALRRGPQAARDGAAVRAVRAGAREGPGAPRARLARAREGRGRRQAALQRPARRPGAARRPPPDGRHGDRRRRQPLAARHPALHGS